MNEEYAEVPFGVGSSVIFSTDDKKYVGMLMGRDEDFVYFKASHVSEVLEPELSAAAESLFRGMVDMMGVWELRWFCLRHRLGSPVRASKEVLRGRVYDWMVWDFLGSQNGVERFVEIASPVAMGIPLIRVENFQSLSDVMNGQILSELDFPYSGEYNGDYGNKEG